jgi:hydrogenase large subunit
MPKTITIDPLTRIEGHLKITVEVDGGVVTDARSVGPMYRGFEKLLEGKDPRDASFITSRFCGVCFSVHTMASSLTLDDAFGVTVPTGGRLLRNLIMGAQFVYDHILHFYHLTALDYIDIAKAAAYTGSDAALKQVAAKVAALVKAGDAHPLAPSYKPDQYCVDDPDGAVTLVAHYLDALKQQMLAKRMGAIFGGRAPHYQSIVVGGVTKLPEKAEVARFRDLLKQVTTFVNDVYIKDAVALATGKLWPLATTDFGVGHPNFLAYGSFDQTDSGSPLLSGGVITGLDPDPTKIVVGALDQTKITESVKHSWYKQTGPLHPSVGETDVDPDAAGGYSFCKAPRYDGKPYEVGPLARMLIRKEKRLADLVAKGVKPGAVARHAARAFETALVCDAMATWLDELEAEMAKPGFKVHDTAHWEPPATAQGKGFYDAPRGALGHWISIKNAKIERYQAVVPSTWNSAPRDDNDVRGPYEESLIGCPVPDENNPINVARVIRSFDPCLGCAVHLIDPGKNELKRFVVDPTMGTWG